MTKEELKTAVLTEIEQASEISELQLEREQAIDYYRGEKLGNEVEGKSQVVSTDVQETIEWMMPSLMRVFASTDKAVIFDPVGPEDEDAARQETDVVNHVFYKENNGFLNLYTFVKDALMVKTGTLKFWWDDDEEVVREEYTGLSEQELVMLLDDPDVEPIEHDQEGEFHDIVIKRTNNKGRVRVVPVPPEEFLISDDATSIDLQSARFVCHHTLKTRGELVAMGMSRKMVNDLPGHGYVDEPEKLARDDDDDFHDKAEDRVRYDEAYIRVDFDNDGIDELRQVVIAGNKLVSNEPVDCMPFAATTPIILTHKFYGMSVAETVKPIQDIKSALLRGVLDNTYLANQPRHAVQEDMVNLDDLLTSRSGGIVRTQGPPAQTIVPLMNPPLPQQTFQVMDQMESLRQSRTGVGQDTMGLEGNVLAHGRTGVVSQSFDMARMRIELIARVIAETGVKPLFLGIHKLLQQNQDKAKWMKLRGEWTTVDPSEWRDRMNMTVNVGLGTGNRDRQVEGLQLILGLQEKLLQAGQGVTPGNIYNSLEKLVEVLGFRNVETYFTDPATQQPPPQKPDPDEIIAQAQAALAQAQAEVAKNQVIVQNKEAETNRQEAIWKHEEKMKELNDKDMRERTKMELEFQKNIPGAVI